MTDDTVSEGASSLRNSRAGELFRRYGHIVVLTLLMVFMFVTRSRGYDRLVQDDGTIVFTGNDPWYHYRETSYLVENWPTTMPFDAWTGYPVGNEVGQFGTLFDHIMAGVALLLGMGSPSDGTVRLVMIFTPVVMGVLVALPTYVLATRLDDGQKWTGVAAVGFLSLFPGMFFRRSAVGFADHHVAETLFMTLAALALVIAFAKASEELPVYELFVDRSFDAVRGSVKWSALAGLLTVLYMWAWPPGLLFVGILGVFFAIKAVYSHAVNRPIEPTLMVGVLSMGLTGLLMLPLVTSWGFDVPRISLLHVVFPWAVAAGCLYCIALRRYFEGHAQEWLAFPGSLAATAAAVGGLAYALVPGAVSLVQGNIIRTFGLGAHADEIQTIQEAQPMVGDLGNALFAEYGAVFGAAVVGFALIAYRGLWQDDDESLFLAVWGLMLCLASLSQVRFNYYFAVVVAVFAAYGIAMFVRRFDLVADFPRDIQGYQAIAGVFLVLLIIPALIVPVAGGATVFTHPGSTAGDYNQWDDSLEWLGEDTPEVGTFGGAENPMGPHDTYERPADGTFDYPDGAYGVMSWWDYGHWITVESERIPVANPFQQHATEAAEYLLATDEDEAAGALDALDEDADVRYVMVDWQMVNPNSKFVAPVTWHPDRGQTEYLEPVYLQTPEGDVQLATTVMSQQYYESLMVRLYHFHGSAVDPDPLVTEYTLESLEGGETIPMLPRDQPFVQQYDSLEAAENASVGSTTAQVGGIGANPPERVDALEHYRLVYASESSAFESWQYARLTQMQTQLTGLPPEDIVPEHNNWVKTFERVDGATVEGTGPANTTVRASVEMQMPNSADTFTYTQYVETDADGHFEMTVPYASTGYDEWGTDEGYTDTNVQAVGPYTFTAVTTDSDADTDLRVTWEAEGHVSEGQVIGEDESVTTVDLEKVSTEEVGVDDEDADESDDETDEDEEETEDAESEGETGDE